MPRKIIDQTLKPATGEQKSIAPEIDAHLQRRFVLRVNKELLCLVLNLSLAPGRRYVISTQHLVNTSIKH